VLSRAQPLTSEPSCNEELNRNFCGTPARSGEVSQSGTVFGRGVVPGRNPEAQY